MTSTAGDMANADANLIRGGVRVDHAQEVLDQLTDAAIVVDTELRPMAWNARYLQQVGLRQQQFQRRLTAGLRCCDLLRLEVCETACLAMQVRQQRRSQRIDEIQGWVEGAPEDKMTFIVNSAPVYDQSGVIVGTLEIYRDVTAEARIQSRYKALLDAERRRAELLEEEVRNRTRDLEASVIELKNTRAQLIQAEKLSSLGQLVAGVAHEINNPTSFIYGNIKFLTEHVEALIKIVDFAASPGTIDAAKRAAWDELLVESELDYVRDDVLKVISAMSTGAERVASIVRDLRRYVHKGASDAMVATDVKRCLETSLALLKLDMRGLHALEHTFAAEVPQVLANEGQLSQVFVNLLVNAVHAVRGRDGVIKIKLENADGGVLVEISDNGVGIPEANMLKVFDPFFTTKPVGEGTGMGLAIAHSIVESHKGRIRVRSEPGVGTTFTVWIPAAH